MTSTIFSSKEFKTLYKWAFKRNKAIMIILSVMIGLGIVLNLYAIAESGSTVDEAGPVTLGIYEYLAALFTFISAIKTFSFLHNKRTVDMFGALPADRHTIFLTHLLGGLTAVSVPYFAGSLIIMGLQTHSAESFKAGIFIMLTGELMIIAAYIFTALIAYCCGTIIDTILITIGLNGIWISAVMLMYGMMSEIIPGFDFENITDSPILTAFTPYGFGGVDIVYYYESSSSAVAANVLWQVAFTVGVFFLTLYVSRHRRAETSQNGFAFSWLPEVTKACASVVVGSGAGFIAAEVADGGYSNMYVFIFWYIILAVSAYFVLHLIFARGLKGKFSFHALVIGGTSLAAIIMIIALTFGLGIDTYVPAAGNIREVTFDNCTFKDPENIKRVTEIHHLITDKIREENDYPYYIGDDYQDYSYSTYDESINDEYSSEYKNYYKTPKKIYEYVNACDFDFEYHKKAGFTTRRNYYIYTSDNKTIKYDLDKMDDLIRELRASEEYRKNIYPEIFNEKVKNNINIIESAKLTFELQTDTYSNITEGYIMLPSSVEFFKDFAEAYSKDLLAEKEPKISSRESHSVGEEYMIVEFDIKYDKHGEIDGKYYYESNNEYVVENTYKNTIAFFEKYGYTKEASLKTRSDVSTAYLTSYTDFGMTGNYNDFASFVNDMALKWEYDACENQGVDDYSEWHRQYYTEYKNLLMQQAEYLYNNRISDGYEQTPGYMNDYIKETGNYGMYFELEDLLIKELIDYSDHYVSGTLRVFDSDVKKDEDSDKDTDKDKDSDTDKASNDKVIVPSESI